VDGLRTPALEQTPRRLHDGLIQLLVARRPRMVFGGDQDLAAKGPLRTLYHGRDGHGRLLCESRVPAGEQVGHYQFTRSTKMWMVPPHVSPTPKASSSEMP
jgi:hypothetical protein